MSDINNNHFNNNNDQNQQEYVDNTLNPKIPKYFQSLLTQPPLISNKSINISTQTRFQALRKLSNFEMTRVNKNVNVNNVIY